MSNMYDDANAGPTRAQGGATVQQPQGYTQQYPQYQQYPQQGYPPQGYGYGARPFSGFRPQWPIETKPFFLTSEFAIVLLTVIGLAITAATSESVDARYFWAATVALVVGYVISRGIAKSGSKSHATDPREQIDLSRFGGGGNDDR